LYEKGKAALKYPSVTARAFARQFIALKKCRNSGKFSKVEQILVKRSQNFLARKGKTTGEWAWHSPAC
jgi:hypothetical protein